MTFEEADEKVKIILVYFDVFSLSHHPKLEIRVPN